MQKGPSVFIRKAQEEFAKAHKDSVGMAIRGDTLYAIDANRYEDLERLMRDVASGKLIGRHKDVTLRGSRLFVNKLPKEYADAVYAELHSRINL